jgi:hypothetical protein
MTEQAVVVTGRLADEQTVVLDAPINLPPGRVRVTVETLPIAEPGGEFLGKLAAIRRALRSSGYQPRTKEEIDAELQAERSSWEN